jgi:SAM-dependent methyltransferase
MQNPIFMSLGGRVKYFKLMTDWNRHRHRHADDPRIPHPAINYNLRAATSFDEYYQAFIKDACLRELPSLLNLVGYKEGQKDFAMLDFGCGLGRLGFAFTNYFGADPHKQYFGYEIHPDSYNFLTKAYQKYPNARFYTDQLVLEQSYVEMQQTNKSVEAKKSDAIKPTDMRLNERIGAKLDLQFSHSVFTHMYADGIVHALKEFKKAMKPKALCINTWLIVDSFSAASLKCHLADRNLPFEQDGFYTYSKTNPLLCTAYKIEKLREIYREAGHNIVDILFGPWSGRSPTQNFTYQDVVISEPI